MNLTIGVAHSIGTTHQIVIDEENEDERLFREAVEGSEVEVEGQGEGGAVEGGGLGGEREEGRMSGKVLMREGVVEGCTPKSEEDLVGE